MATRVTQPTIQPATVEFLQVEPTTRCNFTCGFCCGREMDQTDLDFEDFAGALDTFPSVSHLELQGEGEPLLHPRFFEMVKLASSRGTAVSTITNGSLFGPDRIGALLDCGLRSLLVSIESPDADEFRAIRGGRLDRVVSGIESLLAARAARPQDVPAVGFAVTVLRSTQHHLPAIVELYKRLGMDGGIQVQPLNGMAPYENVYDTSTRSELLSGLQPVLLQSRLVRLMRSGGVRRSGVRHFWDELSPGAAVAATGGAPACPWLERAAYVTRHGDVGPCPFIKDTTRFGLGRVRDARDRLAVNRDAMRRTLAEGRVPPACRGCVVADAVVGKPGRVRLPVRASP